MFELGGFLLVLSLILFVVECILYTAKTRWYFLLGPAIHRQAWQTSGSIEQVSWIIDDERPRLKLKSKRSDRRGKLLYVFRFRMWDASIYSRIVLRLEPAAHGAVISYEVRPFITPAMVGLSVLLMSPGGAFSLFILGYFMLIVLMYAVGTWWDLRKLKSLAPLRMRLKPLGLSICERCRYDRFGLADQAPCPECGHGGALSAPPADSARPAPPANSAPPTQPT